MNSDDYISPSLVGLDTKEDELEALQVIREGANFQYKELGAEDERIVKKLKLTMKVLGHNAQHYFIGTTDGGHQDGRNDNRGGDKQGSVTQ